MREKKLTQETLSVSWAFLDDTTNAKWQWWEYEAKLC